MTRTVKEILGFCDEALDGMAKIVLDLGDELVNTRPEFPGANSPYVILTHCLGVMETWGGHVIAGREIQRDRDAEFVATGSVRELVDRVPGAKRKLVTDLESVDLEADVKNESPWHREGEPRTSNAWAAIHILEELAQHHGHMEITRDWLKSRQP